jgi:photosystem II stability/assembly factor-like uncharacterized protein
MAKNFTICVGSLGIGLWRSPDGGMSWARGRLWKGYQGGRSVFGLAVHPQDPRVIYAGADDGVYRSEDRSANFEHIDSPLDSYKVWRIAIDPAAPHTMFAGTAPPALFRSRDGGDTWTRPSGGLMDEPDIHDIKLLPGKSGAAVVTLPRQIPFAVLPKRNLQTR